MTLREAISSVKKSIKEVSADSRMTNKQVYSKLYSVANTIIQRESDALKLASLDIFQEYKCVKVTEVPAIDNCLGLSSKYSMYRTEDKLPEMYRDTLGPMIRRILSLDKSTSITYTTLDSVIRSKKDTNAKYDKTIYAYFSEGYLFLTKKLPIQVHALFKEDISYTNKCIEQICIPFLDQEWAVPHKLEDTIISLVVQQFAGVYKRTPEQSVVDKNPNT